MKIAPAREESNMKVPNETMRTYVKLRLGATEKYLWKEAAKKEGIPLGTLIRRIMREYFNLSE